MKLEIYSRFRDLLPPLSKTEFEQLEASVLDEGVREPIRVWENKIIDGHNRYKIAQENDLDFDTEEMIFPDEDAVCEWMIINQLGRRNLEQSLKTLFIGQLYELQKKRRGGDRKTPEFIEQNQSATVAQLIPEKSTADKIAEDFNVSPRTVHNAAKTYKAFENADEETKDQFKRGEISQKKLVDLSKPPKEQDKTDTIDRTRSNDHTNNFKYHGKQIASLAAELLNKIEEFENYCYKSNIDVLSIAPLIGANKKTIRTIEASASGLKNVEVCPLCAAKGCPRCSSGYLDKQNAEYVRKDVQKGREVALSV